MRLKGGKLKAEGGLKEQQIFVLNLRLKGGKLKAGSGLKEQQIFGLTCC